MPFLGALLALTGWVSQIETIIIMCFHIYIIIFCSPGVMTKGCFVRESLSFIRLFVCMFETGFLTIALAVLELTLWTGLALNHRFSCLCILECWD